MRLILLFFTASLLISCKKYKPSDEAFFIKPGPITVSTTLSQGSGSHKITDLWLYVNGKFQGAFPVENTIPVVTRGESVKINVFAGIKKNGIAGTRIYSNFYSLLEFDTLVPGGITITRPFTFKYSTAVTFTWTENFDGTGYSLKRSPYSDTTFSIAPPAECFEGRSAELGLSAQSPTGSVAQVESSGVGFELPTNSSDVFIELNYRCSETLAVGLLGDGGYVKPVINLNPVSEWNKIYIHLGDVVGSSPISTKYKVYFRMLKTTEGSAPRAYFDNIKLFYIP